MNPLSVPGHLIDQEYVPACLFLGVRDLAAHGTHGLTAQLEVSREHRKQPAMAIRSILQYILMSAVFVQSSMPPFCI
jgi:hypothetical protein